MYLRKKHILILGGSSDIGIGLIDFFLKENWKVTAHCNKNHKKLKKINHKDFNYIKLDFSKIKDEKILINNFSDNFDSFLNLIGYIDNQSFENFKIKDTINTLKINTLIPMKIIGIIIKNMKKNKFGRIVNCSSVGVKYGGGSNTFNYSLSKQTLEFIPSSIRKLANKNIFYNVIRLGVVDTKIHSKIKRKKMSEREKLIPIGKVAKVTDILNFIYLISSHENKYLTGEVINISGGE